MTKIIRFIKNLWVRRSSQSLINFYRNKGIKIGKGTIFRYPQNTTIDTMRPSLITIGNNVDINDHFSIKAHDFGHRVFLPLFGHFYLVVADGQGVDVFLTFLKYNAFC